jgi:hypothetical protein
MEEEQPTPKKPEKASISAKLEALGSDKKRPQTALVAENLESIERAIERGIPAISIWKALQEEGITLTLRGFETALYRLRKKKAPQRSEALKPPAANLQAVPPGAQLPTSPPKPPQVQSTTEEEDDKAYEEFKKSVAHLPIVQRSKKLSDFMEKQQEARPNYNTRKLLGLGEFSKPAETSPPPETSISAEKPELQKLQEDYKAFKESLPAHLSISERAKLLEKWRRDRENQL